MCNVLIVDDEPGHLMGLSKIIRRIRPNYVVRTAKNGAEALTICDEERFQIIITDIQMPIMNGLDFYERLPNSPQPQKVIFLSGFDYFEYAQKAIGLGSFEYVLKPVDIDKFTTILEKAERSIEKELAVIHEKEQMSAKLSAIVPLYHNRILSEWIGGQPLSQANRRELEHSLLFRGGGSVIAASIGDARHLASEELEARIDRIKASMQALLSEYGDSISFVPDHNRSMLITVTNAELSESLLARIESRFKSNVSADLSIGVSAWSDSVARSAPELYKEACIALMEGFYTDGTILFRIGNSNMDPDQYIKLNARYDAIVGEAVQSTEGQSKQDKLHEATRELLARMLIGERYPVPAELIANVKKLLVKLTEGLEYLKPEVRESLLQHIAASLDDVFHLNRLKTVIAERLSDISAAILEARRDSKENVIHQCLSYINEHYMEDLSLESVAAVFHFNSSYFCHYFKSKLNINFSQYLTQVRLTKAKELLEQSNGKIYQVASQLGYQDVKYFNRVFKKEFGLTPEEFRMIARTMKQA